MPRKRSTANVAAVLQVGCLAALFAFYAAAYSLPGRAYFSLTGLNDTSRGVSFNVLLQPALLVAAVLLMLRWQSGRGPAPLTGHKTGTVVALGLWFVGGTLAWIANIDTPLVSMTYWSVFACGAALYVAARGLTLEDRHVEVIFLGLIVGALLPLTLGLLAFAAEWGVPDLMTVVSAHLNPGRMMGYEDATFGNRGNTGVFLVTVVPPLLWLLVDQHRGRAFRVACAAFVAVAALNLLVIEVRAAFLSLLFAIGLIWRFKSRSASGYFLFAMSVLIAISAVSRFAPDLSTLFSERFQPVLTLSLNDDSSVAGRTAAIAEAWGIAIDNWGVGIGPGAALTVHSMTSAHQLQVQQAMETGVLGLLGSALFALGLLWGVFRTIQYGPSDPLNRRRFLLLIGPVTFAVYGVIANVTLNIGYTNTWTVLVVTMVALMPPFQAGRSPFLAPRAVIERRRMLLRHS